MRHLKVVLGLVLAIGLAGPALAETQNVKVSGSLDVYGLFRQNYDLSDGDQGSIPATGAVNPVNTPNANQQSETDNYFMSITQLQVSADLTDNVSTVVNLINQRDWNANDFVDPSTNTATVTANTGASEFDIVLDLAYVKMKEIFYSPLTLTVGRQDLVFGRGFIVGWNPQDPQGVTQADEFTQIQSFDAIRATLDFSPWTLDFVYSKIDENSHNPEDDRDLYVANVNYKFAEYNAVAEAYYVGEYDRATRSGVGGAMGSSIDTFGGRLQFDPISQMTLGAELAYQGGEYSGTVAVGADRDRDAWALDLFGEYRWDNPWKPMLGLQYVYLSGEENLATGTTDNYGGWTGNWRGPIYGWIHDYLGFFYTTADANDQPAGTNQQHISIYGTMKPMDDLQLSVNYFHFWTAADAHIGIITPNTSTLDGHMGDEIDTMLTYNYTADVTFNFMADWFIPGSMYTDPNDVTATQFVSEVKVTF